MLPWPFFQTQVLHNFTVYSLCIRSAPDVLFCDKNIRVHVNLIATAWAENFNYSISYFRHIVYRVTLRTQLYKLTDLISYFCRWIHFYSGKCENYVCDRKLSFYTDTFLKTSPILSLSFTERDAVVFVLFTIFSMVFQKQFKNKENSGHGWRKNNQYLDYSFE